MRVAAEVVPGGAAVDDAGLVLAERLALGEVVQNGSGDQTDAEFRRAHRGTETGGALAHAREQSGAVRCHFQLGADRPPDAVREAGNDIFALALDLGGTVTGEHGVGLLKRDWLAREAGADVLDVHATLKSALDPRGILNPAKGF